MATASRVSSRSGEGSAQGAVTRQRLLDATARVLSERGYAGTKLSVIAEYAEVQAPAIYHYFDNRESLIEEAMWTGLAQLNVVMRESLDAMPAELDALERLLGAVEIQLRYMFSTSDYAVAYIRNSAQLPPAIRERQAQEESRLALVWRDLFQAADAAGFLRRDLDLTIMRLNVVNSINISAEWWTPRLGSLGELVSTTQELVRSSVTPR